MVNIDILTFEIVDVFNYLLLLFIYPFYLFLYVDMLRHPRLLSLSPLLKFNYFKDLGGNRLTHHRLLCFVPLNSVVFIIPRPGFTIFLN